MVAFILFLILAWVVVGIIGFVVHGLFWLFIIACVGFALTLIGGPFAKRRLTGRRHDRVSRWGQRRLVAFAAPTRLAVPAATWGACLSSG